MRGIHKINKIIFRKYGSILFSPLFSQLKILLFFYKKRTVVFFLFFPLLLRAHGDWGLNSQMSSQSSFEEEFADGYENLEDSQEVPFIEYGGFCPVCLIDMEILVKGHIQYQLVYHSKLYLFPQQKQLDLFKKDPQRYIGTEAEAVFVRLYKKKMKSINAGSSDFVH